MDTPYKAEVLLVTATEVETWAVRALILQQGGIFERRVIDGQAYFDLGVISDARIFLVQSEMGTVGPGGATLVVYEGIRALSPSTVVMVGIAFGLRPREQNLGDILVSRQLVGYELQKIEQGPGGEEIIRPRGDRVQASPRLLSRLRASVFDWQGPEVFFGLMLSGDKLVNHKNFRNKLLGIEPEAVGGEMEGTGVYSAAFREKVDWILVKAICDWADGNKDENKDTHQRQAAENAVRFTFHVLQQGGLISNNIDPSASSQETGRAAPPSRQAIGTTLCTYDIHSSYVVAVAWEPGGNRVASAGGDGLVRVWEADTGHTLLTYRGHPPVFKSFNMAPTIYTIAWSPEGLRLASAGVGTDIHVWDVATGQDIVTYTRHSGLLPDVWALAWSPDGKRIASACSAMSTDKTIHIWNATTGGKILHYDSHYGVLPNFSVSSVAWSPQGDRIASTCGDKTIRLWDITTGKRIAAFQTSSDWVYMIAWSPDGRCLALANGNSTAEILDASTGRILLTYKGHHGGVRDIAWSPDGSRLATASNDTTVQIWDAINGTCLYTHDEHAAWTTSVAWSPDGTRIASASNDKTVQVWQAT
jgi:WD40 repeat protein/nucleoside phosphorylase